MAKVSRYQKDGFYLISQLETGGLLVLPADTDNIVKGDAIHDDTTGYMTNATTAFANTFAGIANADCDNSSGSKGDKNVYIIPPLRHYQFIVPVEQDAVIAQTAVGTICDLENNDDIDISDTTGASQALGFYIDEIDASAEAVAVNTYGYAIGHFVGHHA